MQTILRLFAAISLYWSVSAVQAERLVLVGASYGKNILAVTDAEGAFIGTLSADDILKLDEILDETGG